jgi:hypothetical protein
VPFITCSSITFFEQEAQLVKGGTKKQVAPSYILFLPW